MPFGQMWWSAPIMAAVDGPTEVHKITVARQVLREYRGTNGLFPTQHSITLREAAVAKLGQQAAE
jgi:acyl-CoA dehydrogenase